MNCPVCNVALTLAERGGVEIDYCPKCRGVWLDRGELDKIIERTAMMESSANPPLSVQGRYREEDDDYRRSHRPHKRKSWLSDVFDFD